MFGTIDLLAILQKSLDQALFLYSFIREVLSNGVRASITIMDMQKFFKMHQNFICFRFFFRIAKRSTVFSQLLVIKSLNISSYADPWHFPEYLIHMIFHIGSLSTFSSVSGVKYSLLSSEITVKTSIGLSVTFI